MSKKIKINTLFILRMGLGGALIYFGSSILISPGHWISFIPYRSKAIISPVDTLSIYGTINLILGLLIILGIILPVISFIAFLNFLFTIIVVGIGNGTFQFFGLAMMAIALSHEAIEKIPKDK